MIAGTQDAPPGWYYRLSEYFKDKFCQPVYKIPIDAGFTCPNRDGTISHSGCSFCYNPSFSYQSARTEHNSVKEQIRQGKSKKPGSLYLAYFQSYTNTYASIDKLKAMYNEALEVPDIVGMSIATRPDCVPEEVLNLIQGYSKNKLVWLEYGLQTKHDQTLLAINRGHDYNAFIKALHKTQARGIETCAHIILGLPGETKPMMIETIKALNRLNVNGVKFHHLQVIEQTIMAKQYKEKMFKTFKTLSEYIPLLADCIEHLNKNIVVHRLASQVVDRKLLIAPHWPESSGQIASILTSELVARQSWQGKMSFEN